MSSTIAPIVTEKVKVPKAKAEKVKEPKAEKVKEPKAEKVKEPKAEKVKEPKAEKVKEPKAEKVKEPKAEKVKEPKAEKVKEPKAEDDIKGETDAKADADAPSAVLLAALLAQSTEHTDKLQQCAVFIASLKASHKVMEKRWHKELKASQKLVNKKRRKAGDRKPSGFIKPAKISDELAAFIGKPIGHEMARTDVTKEIDMYVKAHKLADPKNGRNIIPDAALSKLLNIDSSVKLTYFNLQTYMCPLFKAAEVKA
jgi:chromatin remodeling complex protein RSC6